MGSWNQAYVKCPFYRRDDGSKILSCEGLTADTGITIKFESKGALQRWIRTCENNYESCELYKLIMRKKYGAQ